MSDEVKLMVLYPQPTDTEQFEQDYQTHLNILHQKMELPPNSQAYSVTKMHPSPTGALPYYQIFSMTFANKDELQKTMSSAAMQEIAAHANKISTGGEPVILIGSDMVTLP